MLVNKSDYTYAKLLAKSEQTKEETIEIDDKEGILLGLKPINEVTISVESIEWESTESLTTYKDKKVNFPNIIIHWSDDTETSIQFGYLNVGLDNNDYYKQEGTYELHAYYNGILSTNSINVTVAQKSLVSIEWNTAEITIEQNTSSMLPYIKLIYNDESSELISASSQVVELSDNTYMNVLGDHSITAIYKSLTTTNTLIIHTIEKSTSNPDEEESPWHIDAEVYEDENNDVWLDLKSVSCDDPSIDVNDEIFLYMCENNGYNDCIEIPVFNQIYIGKNKINDLLGYLSIDNYQYETNYIAYILIGRFIDPPGSSPVVYSLKINIQLSHNKEYYQKIITQSPTFKLLVNNVNDYTITCIEPLIYEYKAQTYTIENIDEFDLYIDNNIKLITNIETHSYELKDFYFSNINEMYIKYQDIYLDSIYPIKNSESMAYPYNKTTYKILDNYQYEFVSDIYRNGNDVFDDIAQALNCQKDIVLSYINLTNLSNIIIQCSNIPLLCYYKGHFDFNYQNREQPQNLTRKFHYIIDEENKIVKYCVLHGSDIEPVILGVTENNIYMDYNELDYNYININIDELPNMITSAGYSSVDIHSIFSLHYGIDQYTEATFYLEPPVDYIDTVNDMINNYNNYINVYNYGNMGGQYNITLYNVYINNKQACAGLDALKRLLFEKYISNEVNLQFELNDIVIYNINQNNILYIRAGYNYGDWSGNENTPTADIYIKNGKNSNNYLQYIDLHNSIEEIKTQYKFGLFGPLVIEQDENNILYCHPNNMNDIRYNCTLVDNILTITND